MTVKVQLMHVVLKEMGLEVREKWLALQEKRFDP